METEAMRKQRDEDVRHVFGRSSVVDATTPAVVPDAQQYDWREDWNRVQTRIGYDENTHVDAMHRLAAYIERLEAERDALLAERTLVDIVFDGPPSHESGRFVEVEDMSGAGVRVGEWIDRGNGYWALRIPTTTPRG